MKWLTQPLSWPDAAALQADLQAILRRWRDTVWADWPVWPVSLVATVALVLFAIGALAMWSWGPWSAHELEALVQTQQTLQKQVGVQRDNLQRMQRQMPQDADPQRRWVATQQTWPTTRQVQGMFAAVYRQALEHGLQVEWFKPEAVRQAHGLSVQPLGLRLRGPFAQVVAWSEGLFQSEVLWVPEKWLMTAHASDQVLLDAELHLYLRSTEAEADDSDVGTAAPFASPFGIAALQTEPRTQPFAQPQVSAEPRAEPEVLGDHVPALQRWPLQSLRMVGSFITAGTPHALVQTPVGLFRVGVGQRLGAEGGRVVRLDEQQLHVRVVERTAGRVSERLEALSLQLAHRP